jgi:hypothetical protein
LLVCLVAQLLRKSSISIVTSFLVTLDSKVARFRSLLFCARIAPSPAKCAFNLIAK